MCIDRERTWATKWTQKTSKHEAKNGRNTHPNNVDNSKSDAKAQQNVHTVGYTVHRYLSKVIIGFNWAMLGIGGIYYTITVGALVISFILQKQFLIYRFMVLLLRQLAPAGFTRLSISHRQSYSPRRLCSGGRCGNLVRIDHDSEVPLVVDLSHQKTPSTHEIIFRQTNGYSSFNHFCAMVNRNPHFLQCWSTTYNWERQWIGPTLSNPMQHGRDWTRPEEHGTLNRRVQNRKMRRQLTQMNAGCTKLYNSG